MLQQISGKLANRITSTRKRIETSITQLTESFSINATKARSFHGLLGRINQKILSYTTALFLITNLLKISLLSLSYLFKHKK